MLELRRYDPDGEEFKPDAYVFGNEVGERLKNYQRAWSTLRLRAIAHGPHWPNDNRRRTWPSCGKTCSSGHNKDHMLIESFVSERAEKA